jgi:RNA polymerase sigma-70 factor (ECF subfamily)
VSQQPSSGASPAAGLLELYDVALPAVYGYLLRRCGRVDLAEELTAETFLAAVDAARSGSADSPTAAWLIGVARHKLVDHWRREERVERRLHALAGGFAEDAADTWDARLDAVMARDALDRLTPAHRAALTLRYLDDLPVPEVARLLDCSLHATEALLVRARAAFRRTYADAGRGDDRG